MSFESVLTYVGRFGRYQAFIFILVGIHGLIGAFINVGIVFIAPSVDHWCRVPRLDRFNLSAEEYRALVAPEGEMCRRYDINFTEITAAEVMSWNETVAQLKPNLTKCDHGFMFDKSMFSYTATEQYAMVCDQSWMTSVSSSVFMCGLLVGAISSGALADRFGRRPAFVALLFCCVFAPIINGWMPYYGLFALMRLVNGFLMVGAYTVGFVLGTEMLATEYRMLSGIILHSAFALGIMILPGLAYLMRSHVWLQTACGIMYIPYVIFCWFVVPESPRWLIARDRHDEAYTVLETIAKYNKRTIPDQATTMKIIAAKDEDEVKDAALSGRKPTVVDLVRTPRLRARSLNLFFNWAVNTMVYYGLTYGVGTLGGSLYLATFLSGAIELPSFALMIFGLNKIGRRCMLGGSLILCGLFCYAMVGLMEIKGIALMIVGLLGKLFITTSFSVVYLYTTEIYPTAIRNVGLGAGSTCARVGGLLAPQIGELKRFWSPLPAAVFGAVSLLGGALTFLLPESTGRDLPHTLTEAENFGKDDKFTLNCFEAVRRPPTRFSLGTANPGADDIPTEVNSLSTNQIAPDKLTNPAFSPDEKPAQAQSLITRSKQVTDV